jgi:hypothetical protein
VAGEEEEEEEEVLAALGPIALAPPVRASLAGST